MKSLNLCFFPKPTIGELQKCSGLQIGSDVCDHEVDQCLLASWSPSRKKRFPQIQGNSSVPYYFVKGFSIYVNTEGRSALC